jgi:hypothetical protein
MNRSRATRTAFFALIAWALATGSGQSASPFTSSFDSGPRAIAAALPDDDDRDDPTTAPEPVSLALFGIGISSFITLRRFRKLFN